ncbi:MAG: c-type cytochrome [Saprospiraceae bacterium]|nr:c-type cytochrome [Saprospiraceae bacterium]
MKQTIISVMFLSVSLVILFFMSCEFDPPKGSRPYQVMQGKAIFAEQCAPCHGMKDKAATVDTLKTPAPDLTLIMKRRGVTKFPIAEIARFIDGRQEVAAHGPREMPVWGEVYKAKGMTEGEIRGRKGQLVAYLMEIQNLD